jgi:hypothetical protein
VTRIDIHHAWEEPNKHAIRLTLGGSHDNIHKPLLGQIGHLLPEQSLGPRPHSPSRNKSTTRSGEVWFDIVVTKANHLIGPQKTRHVVSRQLKTCHRGQNDAVLNQYG